MCQPLVHMGIFHIQHSYDNILVRVYHPNHVAVKFTNRINKYHISIINKTRMNLKRMNSGYRTPKVDTSKLTQLCRVKIKRAKKTILAITQNSIQGVTIPLTK